MHKRNSSSLLIAQWADCSVNLNDAKAKAKANANANANAQNAAKSASHPITQYVGEPHYKPRALTKDRTHRHRK